MRSKDDAENLSHDSQTASPKLRFPEFRERWAECPLARIYSFKGSNSLSRDKLNYSGGSLRNIHYGDIHTKFSPRFCVDAEVVPYINNGESHSAIRPDNYCAEGDMVFADASEDLSDIGKAIEVIDAGDAPLLAGLHTILARPKPNTLVTGFGASLFASDSVRKQIQREAQGAKVLGLSANRLGAIRLAYPANRREQQKITDCLSSLDACIAAEIRKLDALKVYKQGLMQQLFPAEGHRLPGLRFVEFKGDWTIAPLENHIQTVAPPKKLQTTQYMDSGSFPVIDQSPDPVAGWTDAEDSLVLGPFPLIVFGDHTCTLKMADRPFAQGADGIKIFRATDGLSTEFVYQALCANPPMMESYKRHFSVLKERDVSFPSDPTEQWRISSVLSTVDGVIAAQARRIAELKLHKLGLLQGLFPAVTVNAP